MDSEVSDAKIAYITVMCVYMRYLYLSICVCVCACVCMYLTFLCVCVHLCYVFQVRVFACVSLCVLR